MKVKSISRKGEGLSPETIEAGFLRTSDFPIKHGVTYVVYAICLWKSVLLYLVIDPDHDMPYPEWFPAELFSVVDGILPLDWFYRFIGYEDESKVIALWGYRELVEDLDHFDRLNDHETYAMGMFLLRKKEIDKQLGYE